MRKKDPLRQTVFPKKWEEKRPKYEKNKEQNPEKNAHLATNRRPKISEISNPGNPLPSLPPATPHLFGEQQFQAIKDYLQASLKLNYKGRMVG